MSLSRLPKSNKGDISTFQVMLEMAQSLSSLIDDPKALQKAADSAYALDAEAEAKAKSAYDDIAKAETATQEALKQQGIASDLVTNANIQKAEANNLFDAVRKEQSRLASVDAIQGAFALKLSTQESDLKDRESKLIAAQNELQKQLNALSIKQKELNDFDAELKDKAKQVAGIIGA